MVRNGVTRYRGVFNTLVLLNHCHLAGVLIMWTGKKPESTTVKSDDMCVLPTEQNNHHPYTLPTLHLSCSPECVSIEYQYQNTRMQVAHGITDMVEGKTPTPVPRAKACTASHHANTARSRGMEDWYKTNMVSHTS